MKKLTFPLMAFLVMLLTGCEVVEGIFKAGLFVGIIVVVLVLAIIFWIVSKLR